MKRLALLVLLLASCKDSSEGFPITPGGMGGVGGTIQPDGAIDDYDASAMITGRVCLLVTSPQSLTACESSGAAGFTVTLGTSVATTATDGAFTLRRPASTAGLVWSVTGNTIMPSVIKFTGAATLPAIDSTTYQGMLSTTGPMVANGSGAVMLRVTRGAALVEDATVTTQPAADSLVYYDNTDPLLWQQTATGPLGVAWVPSIAPGNVTLTVTSSQVDTELAAQPVVANAVTYVLVGIP